MGAALCLSEVMTIGVGVHLLGYWTFKHYYLGEVLKPQRRYFPTLVSYHRFVELLPGTLALWCCLLVSRFGRCGIGFIDSTKISLCHNRRIWSGMAEFAARGKTSVEGFDGFKGHLVLNDEGELRGAKLPGKVDDRNRVPELARGLFGKLSLRKRSIIETVTFRQKKPSLNLRLPQALPAVVL